jgi:hypothetical protein
MQPKTHWRPPFCFVTQSDYCLGISATPRQVPMLLVYGLVLPYVF